MRNFSRIWVKNLLSFLALRIREGSLLFMPAQSGGMEIFYENSCYENAEIFIWDNPQNFKNELTI